MNTRLRVLQTELLSQGPSLQVWARHLQFTLQPSTTGPSPAGPAEPGPRLKEIVIVTGASLWLPPCVVGSRAPSARALVRIRAQARARTSGMAFKLV